MSVYYGDDGITLHHGDAVAVLAKLEPSSVDCIVTSPPYFGLRDYGVDGQIGAEPTPAEFVEALVAVFREARRVLADDGTLWLNLGDSYYSGRGASTGVDEKNPARRFGVRSVDKGGADWAKPKDLLGIPWRVAFALQDDGWTLRNDIVWSKPNAMPESVTDRLSNRHEHVFLLTKSRRYWFDLDPIREPLAWPDRITGHTFGGANKSARLETGSAARRTGGTYDKAPEGGRNPGDVWTLPTQPFPAAHFATMPPALAGSGTTGLAATKHGRRYVGIDLNEDYLRLSLETRLAQGALTEEAI